MDMMPAFFMVYTWDSKSYLVLENKLMQGIPTSSAVARMPLPMLESVSSKGPYAGPSNHRRFDPGDFIHCWTSVATSLGMLGMVARIASPKELVPYALKGTNRGKWLLSWAFVPAEAISLVTVLC
jgi:hypothetical protein